MTPSGRQAGDAAKELVALGGELELLLRARRVGWNTALEATYAALCEREDVLVGLACGDPPSRATAPR